LSELMMCTVYQNTQQYITLEELEI